MNTSNRIIQFASRQVGLRHSSHGHAPAPKITYSDLPIPSGSWQTSYDAQQRKFNALLALGIGTFVGTIIVGKTIGMYEFYTGYAAKPAEIKSYKKKEPKEY